MERTHKCENCFSNQRSYRRDISAQIWSLLLHWNEVLPGAVDRPICDDCYQDIRDILIDREGEKEHALMSGTMVSPAAGKTEKIAV